MPTRCVCRGVEVGMSLRRGSLKPEIGTIEDLIGEVLAERQVAAKFTGRF